MEDAHIMEWNLPNGAMVFGVFDGKKLLYIIFKNKSIIIILTYKDIIIY